MSIELGDRVKDRISGLSGIVTGITHWLYGCTLMVVQPETEKDGKPAETFCVDEPQLELVQPRAIEPSPWPPAPAASTHGPRDDPRRQPDPRR